MAAAAAKPQLFYFNGRGRGEVSRLICAEAKIAYDDKRVEGKDWPAMKPTTPFGQMPLLKHGAVTIAQSAAIERYLARLGKLYGANDLEGAQIDMVCEGVHDAVKAFHTAFWTKDAAEKKTKMEAYFKDEFPRWAGQLTALLKANNGGAGYFVGAGVTYADILVYVGFEDVHKANAEAFKAFPELTAHFARVAARPNIAAWIKARPETSF
jgi:glutathione S-transferase